MSRILIVVLFPFLFSSYLIGQEIGDNILNNKGEICTVVFGEDGQNITITNNFQYYFPEKEILSINNQLKEILNREGVLSEEKRKKIEKDLNISNKIKEFEKKIESYQKQFTLLQELIEEVEGNNELDNQEIQNIKQLLTLGITATQNSKCLFEDYSFEEVKDKDGNTYHRIERKILDGDPNFIIVYPFNNGRAKIKQYNKYGYIDESGKKIIPAKYDYAEDFMGHSAVVGIKRFEGGMDYHFMDRGFYLYPQYYSSIQRISEELSLVQKFHNGNYTLLDSGHNQIKGTNSKSLKRDKDGYWIREAYKKVGKKNEIRYGLLSPKGKEILSAKYKFIDEESDGFRRVQCENNLWGFLDKFNKMYLYCFYTYANSFSNDRSVVKMRINDDSVGTTTNQYTEKYALINKDGAEVIPSICDTIIIKSEHAFSIKILNEDFKLNEYGVCQGSSKKKKRYKELYRLYENR